MFSVIMPLYNKAKYVEKAIQSIINQSFKEFELIIVDDGSTDNSLQVVKSLLTANCKLQIIEQQNSGVSTARNNGVAAAKYDYIAFLDADDWWAENYLEEMAKLIAEFPDAALWASSYFKVKNGKNTPAKIGVNQNFTQGYFDYFEAYSNSPWMPVWTGTTVMKKSVFEALGGFNPNIKLGEDFEVWVRTALKYKVALLNKPLAFYNQNVETATRGVRMHKPENHMLFALTELYEQEKSNPKLHQVLDNLRVYGLFPYFLNNNTRQHAINELNRVDWTKQPKSEYKKYYQTPISYLKCKMFIINILSHIKGKILKKIYYIKKSINFTKKYYLCPVNRLKSMDYIKKRKHHRLIL